MKIKIKGKHIILLAMAVVVVLSAAFIMADDLAYQQAFERTQDLSSNSAEYRNVLLHVAKQYPNHEDAPRALYYAADGAMPSIRGGRQPNTVYIFPGARTENPDILGWGLDEMEKIYETIVYEYPESPWAQHSLIRLAELNLVRGELETAEEYGRLALGVGENTKIFTSPVAALQGGSTLQLVAEIAEKQGKYQEALAYLQRYRKEFPKSTQLEQELDRARILIKLGDLDKAEEVLLAIPEKASEEFKGIGQHPWQEKPEHADEDISLMQMNISVWVQRADRYLYQIEALRDNSRPASVNGRIISANEGVAGIQVYLLDGPIVTEYINPSELEDLPVSTTDDSGYYHFDNLLPGKYGLALVVPKDRVQNVTLKGYNFGPQFALNEDQKLELDLSFAATVPLLSPKDTVVKGNEVTFKWQSIPSATRYALHVAAIDPTDNSYDFVVIDNQITQTKYTIDTSEVPKQLGGVRWDSEGLNPISLLGPFALSDKFSWGVIAYDSNGDMLANSLASTVVERPVFTLDREMENEADRLFADRNYQAAIEAYKAKLIDEPGNQHALLMLARIMSVGVKHDASKPEEALPYYDRYLQIKEDKVIQRERANAYFAAKDYQNAILDYKALLGSTEDNWHLKYRLGISKFRLGQSLEALENLDTAFSEKDNDYLYIQGFIIALLCGEEDRASQYVTDSTSHYGLEKVLDQFVADEVFTSSAEFFAKVKAGDFSTAKQLINDTSSASIGYHALLKYALGEEGFQEIQTDLNNLQGREDRDAQLFLQLFKAIFRT